MQELVLPGLLLAEQQATVGATTGFSERCWHGAGDDAIVDKAGECRRCHGSFEGRFGSLQARLHETVWCCTVWSRLTAVRSWRCHKLLRALLEARSMLNGPEMAWELAVGALGLPE